MFRASQGSDKFTMRNNGVKGNYQGNPAPEKVPVDLVSASMLLKFRNQKVRIWISQIT